ncbi:Cell wall-associated hydrolase, NlpC family [Lachnospiraceae bacterium NK3A20]|jgi:peptidoglycan hydrolase CwlO-like protein|nr:Cell wall-associated hydrolase, NlpC family [Lachnospiraceae bacterium NK3A20]
MSEHRSTHSLQKFLARTALPLSLAVVCTFAPAGEVFADTVSDLQSQTQQTQSQISAAQSNQANLEQQQSAIASSISSTNDVMVQNMASISLLQGEIDKLDRQIAQKQKEYDKAKANEEKQYAAMKERIRFMYEEGNIDYIQILAKSSSFSDLVNKADYVSKLYDYDRRMLEEFQQIQADVKEKQEALEADKDEQETSKNEMEVEQAALQSQMDALEAQYSDYESRIAAAQSEANALAARLKEQNAALSKAVAEKAAAEEAARAAREAAAKAAAEAKAAADAKAKAEAERKAKEAEAAAKRAQAEADAKAKAAEEAAAAKATVSEAAQETPSETASEETQTQSAPEPEPAKEEPKPAPAAPAVTSSGTSGSDVVSFAEQFVGNPYVYGGTSLTNGADCSGFTQSVYAHFGISIGRTDVDQRGNGIAVDSIADARPGDLICYPGHVALYCGNNTIVHASTAKTGIKYSNADYRPYVSIRRLIY